MKANRKFKDGEEAVSAVIGVILMVAITVAIAATVYVYVSGMMGTTDAAPTIAMTKTDTTSTETLTVVSADPSNLDWADLVVLIDGVDATHSIPGAVDAGDVIVFEHDTLANSCATATPTGDYTVAIRHTPTNTLIYEDDFAGNP